MVKCKPKNLTHSRNGTQSAYAWVPTPEDSATGYPPGEWDGEQEGDTVKK